MAHRKKSEIEFIQDTFCPQVAVLCSYDAEVVCRKNALTFVELVQPFCRFNGEIKISDPSNNLCTISNLRVEIKDINSIPPPPLLAKKLLDEAVSSGLSAPQHFIEKQINLNSYNFIANVNTPWFESWRECFIKVGYPDDHEFLKHFLACIFVVSTSHLDPLDQFQKLILQQQQPQSSQNRLPKWLPNVQSIYRYFVLLHDVQEGEISKAHHIYENLKGLYGSSNCHLLQINSKPASAQQQSLTEFDPWLQYSKFNDLYSNNQFNSMQNESLQLDQSLDELDLSINENVINNPLINPVKQNGSLPVKRHGVCLALSDHDRIKTLISEFLQRGLVPYVERTIKILNEQIQSKKSILKSFGIPRRIFGGGSSSNIKPSSSSSSVVSISASGLSTNINQSSSTASGSPITITNSSSFAGSNDELQIRRLADLAFMFRLYDLAFTSYHTCKKEFTSFINNSNNQSNTEQLLNMTLYLAGALEMASISNFMQNFSADTHQSSISQSSSVTGLSSIQSSPSTTSSNSIKTYNFTYIDEAIQYLLNTCKNNYFATRCALLSTEALKTVNQFYKAAFQFISLSSDESDMRSALFLEQAAQCYLAIQNPQPSIRKYAFFMSIAGYRFNKAGQRKHAIRVYKHALDIYENRCWFKAQDHLNFVMSRLNFNLKNIPEALAHIENILIKKKIPQRSSSFQTQTDPISRQYITAIEFSNETNILKDFILYSNTLINESKQTSSLPSIPVPLIDWNNLKVNLYPGDIFKLKHGKILVHNDNNLDYVKEPLGQKEKELISSLNNFTSLTTPRSVIDIKQINELKDMWLKFEQVLYIAAYRTSLPILFKPHLTIFDQTTDNKQMPKVVVNETLAIMFEIKNHLRINLIISDVTLLWKYVSEDLTQTISNETNIKLDENVIECTTLRELNLTPYETYKLRLHLVPKRSDGTLSILGIKYRLGLTSFSTNLTTSMSNIANLTAQLSNTTITENNNENTSNDFTTLFGKQLFEIKGPRLNNNPTNMRSIVYDTDQRLNFKILNQTPLLQIEMDHLPTQIYCEQFERIRVYFINLNNEKSIGNIKIASNGIASSKICFCQVNKKEEKLKLNHLESMNKSEFKFKEPDTENNEKSFKQPYSNNSEILSQSDLIYSVDDVIIGPNGQFELDMWVRGPKQPGEHKFYFMFFYQVVGDSVNNVNTFKYRIIRYEFSLQTLTSLTINNLNVINSNSNPNLILNIEAMNHQNHQTSFELIDSISISDKWQTFPIKKSTNSIIDQNNRTPSTENILSFSLKAKPILSDNKGERVYVYRSEYCNTNREIIPDENVIFYFIKSDLKTQFSNSPSDKSSFINVYFLWRSNSKENDTSNTSYSLTLVRVLDELIKSKDLFGNEQIQRFEYRRREIEIINGISLKTVDKNNNSKSVLKHFLAVTSNCKNKIQNDFNIKKLCQMTVNIELKNLSNTHQFDLILLAKNCSKKNLIESDKNYVWLGCNKKYIHLDTNQTKQLKFKLGFYSNGVFEIGGQSNKSSMSDFKLNLFDSTSTSLNINTNNNVTTVLDDLNDTFTNVIETNNSNNPILNNPGGNLLDAMSGSLCIFNKNNLANRYELFKCLNAFTVTIL